MTERNRHKTKVPFREKSLWKKILILLVWLLVILLLLAGGLVAYLSLNEYKPKAKESVDVNGQALRGKVEMGSDLTLLTWNVGYGALGDNADFFMDGGTHVSTSSEERVRKNMEGISDELELIDPDIAVFQELDVDSTRSHHVDEMGYLADQLQDYDNSFAYNYRCAFVPYPLPPIGQVNAGIGTFARYDISKATRVQLPCPFKYPVSVANLKRCITINRMPVKNSDKELVIINLHLEAYDDGDGKIRQTRMLKQYLEKEVAAGNYVIAAGDFNQTFSNADISAYPAQGDLWQPGQINVDDFGDDFQMLMDTSVPSCRSLDQPYKNADHENFQYYAVDGYIVSKNIEVTSIETQDLQFKYADHNPVVLNVKLLGE